MQKSQNKEEKITTHSPATQRQSLLRFDVFPSIVFCLGTFLKNIAEIILYIKRKTQSGGILPFGLAILSRAHFEAAYSP